MLKTKSAKNIIMSLISMVKSSRNSAKESSIKLFKRLTEKLSLTQYKNIESITKENTFDNVCSKDTPNQGCELTLGEIS